MPADAFIPYRVTPELKTLVRALAEREQITESVLVRSCSMSSSVRRQSGGFVISKHRGCRGMPRHLISVGESGPTLDIASYARPGPGRQGRLLPAEVELISRTVQRAPEVLVKVLTSGGQDLKSVQRHLAYLNRNGELGGKDAPRHKRTESTVNRYLAYLSHVFTIARREWHWISNDPFDGVGKFTESKGRVRFLTDEERDRLLVETAKDRVLHTVVIVALSTAARAGEITNLRWSDVELKQGRVLLRKTKNAHPRTVWLHGEALRLLTEHSKVRRLNDDRVFVSVKGKLYRHRPVFEAACRAANVKDFTLHDLRHTAATYLAREGASERQLKAIGGWKSGVVSRYVHLAAEDARAILEKMNEKILGGKQGA